MSNKKYKTWKYKSEPVPRSTYQRWGKINSENIEISECQTIDEIPSCSKKSEDTYKRKYKVWVKDPSFCIPEATSRRWGEKHSGDNVNNYLSAVDKYERNMQDAYMSDDNDSFYEKEDDYPNDDGNENDDDHGNDNGPGDHDDDTDDPIDDDDYDKDDNDSDDADNESDDEDSDSENVDNYSLNSLYESSKMSLNEAVLNIAKMWMKHKLSKTYLKEHLKLLYDMLPNGNSLPKTPYHFFNYIKKQVPLISIIRHYYCIDCSFYLSSNYQICTECNGDKLSYFFELDLEEQIKQLFENKQLHKKLKNVSGDSDFISDITDGSEYRRVNNEEDRNPFDLTLILYTDGISLVKSEKSHCWPLMFTIAELPPNIRHLYIVTIGIWCDRKSKPSMNLFLQPFCKKLRQCYKDGIQWTNPSTGEKKLSKIKAPLFIADAPARAQIQNILSYNGKYGCNLCAIKTKQCARVGAKKLIRIYPYQNILKLRTRNSMKIQADAVNVIEGVKGHSIITMLPRLDISTCVLPEYMHSVLLGVVKQFINIWITKKGPWKIKKHLPIIDSILLNIKPIKGFARRPRSLSNFNNYKATEFFNFLIFYSLPTLNNFLPEKYFQHWILLVSSISKMLKERIHVNNDLKLAEHLLAEFVKNVKKLYGEHELTYNVHQLLHLSLSVKRWGPLWATSAFMFENENGVLARIVHGNSNLGQELVNNLQLMQAITTLKYKINYEPDVLSLQFKALGKKVNLILNEEEVQIFLSQNFVVEDLVFFSRALINNELFTSLLYKITKVNNYTAMLKINGSQYYGSIRYFFKKAENPYLVLKEFNIAENNFFFNNETKSVVEHILPIEEMNTYFIVEIENIESIKHVIRVGRYVCLRPNLYNVVF